MQDFRNLAVWKRAHALTLALYKATASFPPAELYGLTSQIRRTAVSVPANVAEGCCRSGDAEFARFLHIALGSASELEYHLLLARDLGYLSAPSYKELQGELSHVRRMLASLVRKLRAET